MKNGLEHRLKGSVEMYFYRERQKSLLEKIYSKNRWKRQNRKEAAKQVANIRRQAKTNEEEKLNPAVSPLGKYQRVAPEVCQSLLLAHLVRYRCLCIRDTCSGGQGVPGADSGATVCYLPKGDTAALAFFFFCFLGVWYLPLALLLPFLFCLFHLLVI